jgi:hypothetical protein
MVKSSMKTIIASKTEGQLSSRPSLMLTPKHTSNTERIATANVKIYFIKINT